MQSTKQTKSTVNTIVSNSQKIDRQKNNSCVFELLKLELDLKNPIQKLEFKIGKNDFSVKFDFIEKLKLDKNKSYTLPISIFKFQIAIKNNLQVEFEKNVSEKNATDIKTTNFNWSEKSDKSISWGNFYNSVLKFKYTIETKNYFIAKKIGGFNVLLISKSEVNKIKNTDTVKFYRIDKN